MRTLDPAQSAQRTAKPPGVEDSERGAQDGQEDRAGGIVRAGRDDGRHENGSHAKKDHPDPVEEHPEQPDDPIPDVAAGGTRPAGFGPQFGRR